MRRWLSALPLVLLSQLGCGATKKGGVDPEGPPCEGLSCQVPRCPPGQDTIVRGVVTTPSGEAPLRQAIVYVPRSGAPAPLSSTVGCEVCESPIGAEPIARAVTGADGRFTLRGVPATKATPIVIQKGRFRRTIQVPVSGCGEMELPLDTTRLPRSRGEGDLPQVALAVGDFDAIECVLRAMGIDGAEFTSPLGGGAVHLYDNEAPGGGGAPGGVNIRALVTDLAKMLQYQLIFIGCSDVTNSTDLLRDERVMKNLVEYARRGGRLYVTDWSYDWIQQPAPLSPYLCFEDDLPCAVTTPHGFQAATAPGRGGAAAPFSAEVEQTQEGGLALTAWLEKLPEPVPSGRVPITDLSQDWVLLRQTALDGARYPSTTWLSATMRGQRRPMTVTFDYPAPPAPACGRILYSSYHTRGHRARLPFPLYCPDSMMLPQERILEFLIYELSACVGPIG